MITAVELITRALRLAGVLATEETPSAARADAALRALNGMLAGLETQGIYLDHQNLALTDTVRLPAPHVECVTWMLAARLSVEFGIPRQDVAAIANEHERGLRAAYSHSHPMPVDPALARITRYV